MSGGQQLLLLDTNVWLDYFDQTRPGFQSAVALVRYARRAGIGLLIAPTSCKDFYCQCASSVKRDARASGKEVTPAISAAAEEFAWGCLQSITRMATVASMGQVDVAMSRSIHNLHQDLEDDLIVAVAMRCGVTYLVTGDRKLAASSPVPTLNAAQALAMLGAAGV
jgi:predicted nucleic acid-binding protein